MTVHPAAFDGRGALRFALRDGALLLLTLLAWWFDARARAAGATGAMAVFAALAAGLSAAACGFLLHEWGHLCGAWLMRAQVAFPSTLLSPFLFRFDVARNGAREFLAMSYGGYAGSLLAIVLLAVLLPWTTLSGQVALSAALIGVLATLALELPTTLRVQRGEPLPASGPAYVASKPPEAPEP